MKKIVRIIVGIISIGIIMETSVYATQPQRLIDLVPYMEQRIEAFVLIGLIIMNGALIVYNLVKKSSTKKILIYQIVEIVLIVYFNRRINMGYIIDIMHEVLCEKLSPILIHLSYTFCYMGLLLIIILELISLRKKNEKLCKRFICVTIFLLIAFVINVVVPIYGAEKIYNGELDNNILYVIYRYKR